MRLSVVSLVIIATLFLTTAQARVWTDKSGNYSLEADLVAVWITLKLAAVSTGTLLILGTPLAWWLANTQWRFKFLIESAVALPLVLPPTVLGFYLLIVLGSRGPLGGKGRSNMRANAS